MTTSKTGGLPRTDVPWARYQWPILRGCSAASEGCAHCYAKEWHNRFAKHMGLPPWGKPHFVGGNLHMPMHTRKPGLVFVAPMSDLGHPAVQTVTRTLIAKVMEETPHLTYLVLTKRPGPWLRELPPECWVGVSAENEMNAKIRWLVLCNWAWPAALKFVSVEPMLGPVTFNSWPEVQPDWVIAGPETGRGARPCDGAWIDALAAESPCFFDKRPAVIGALRRRDRPT